MNDQNLSLTPDDPRLTAFALGELEGDERADVAAALARNPALQAVVDDIRATANQLESILAAEPTPAVKPDPIFSARKAAIIPGHDLRKLDGGSLGRLGEMIPFQRYFYIAGGLAAAGLAVMMALRQDMPGTPAYNAEHDAELTRRAKAVQQALLKADLKQKTPTEVAGVDTAKEDELRRQAAQASADAARAAANQSVAATAPAAPTPSAPLAVPVDSLKTLADRNRASLQSGIAGTGDAFSVETYDFSRGPNGALFSGSVTSTAPAPVAPAAGSPAGASGSGAGSEVVRLNPFNVIEPSDNSFSSSSVGSGSRLRLDLRDVPASYSVINRQFIDALGITDMTEAATWAPGQTFTDKETGDSKFGEQGAYVVRGYRVAPAGSNISSSNGTGNQRNFYQSPNTNGDSFSVESYDFGRGPNSVMFGNSQSPQDANVAGGSGLSGVASSQSKIARAEGDVANQSAGWDGSTVFRGPAVGGIVGAAPAAGGAGGGRGAGGAGGGGGGRAGGGAAGAAGAGRGGRGAAGGAAAPAARAATANTESYGLRRNNSFVAVANAPLSTFSIDVDSAAYTNVRRFLRSGQLPPVDAVRVEEMVNYFPYRYPAPEAANPRPIAAAFGLAPRGEPPPFAASLEVASAPWDPAVRLVRVGLKGREVSTADRPRANLVFLLDVSGSMNQPNKLPLVKESMRLLLRRLREDDRVAIVVYAGATGVALPSTTAANGGTIEAAIEGLAAAGSTNGAAGINLAYQIANENFVRGGINRVILCTDGDFNVGVTNQGDLVRMVEDRAKSNVFLTVLGFGMGNLKDSTLELLADKGNGNYGYIDNRSEAEKLLIDQVNGTLVTIAKDVKIQVEFNPAKVAAYRLVGYENRLLAKEDFNNDKVDAGEIGAGHTVTALYEIVPAAGANIPSEFGVPPVDDLRYQRPAANATAGQLDARFGAAATGSDELLTVKIRYKEPTGTESQKLEFPLRDTGRAFAAASPDFKFAAAVAGFGLALREPQPNVRVMNAAIEWANDGLRDDPMGYRAEFIQLVRQATQLVNQNVQR